jgi:uncharacterized protein (DUF362 family)
MYLILNVYEIMVNLILRLFRRKMFQCSLLLLQLLYVVKCFVLKCFHILKMFLGIKNCFSNKFVTQRWVHMLNYEMNFLKYKIFYFKELYQQ